MRTASRFLVLSMLLTSAADSRADEGQKPRSTWRAGAASVAITPEEPLPMAGYAARKEPAEGTEQDLYAKALAIEDRDGNRVVILTLDLIGVTEKLRSTVVEAAVERHDLREEAVLINASHTHCGPAYMREGAEGYFAALTAALVDLIGQSLEQLEPAVLSWSQARCGFAMNRRTPTATGYSNHPNPDGPVDHAVPVLSVSSPEGELQAVLFGYACHNTTMGFRRWLGDYAGYAQQYLEEDHPGLTALFLMGCGGDQNPYPRSELHYAHKHGRSLATAVEAALETNQRTRRHQRPLKGSLHIAYEPVTLEFDAKDRPDVAYPVQVIRFGDELEIIALGSEVTVDYSLRLKMELSDSDGPGVWVAGYSNVYDGYIPSRRVLLEGGYEAASRPWSVTLEERIVGKVHELHDRLDRLSVQSQSTEGSTARE